MNVLWGEFGGGVEGWRCFGGGVEGWRCLFYPPPPHHHHFSLSLSPSLSLSLSLSRFFVGLRCSLSQPTIVRRSAYTVDRTTRCRSDLVVQVTCVRAVWSASSRSTRQTITQCTVVYSAPFGHWSVVAGEKALTLSMNARTTRAAVSLP